MGDTRSQLQVGSHHQRVHKGGEGGRRTTILVIMKINSDSVMAGKSSEIETAADFIPEF
jgi:hypothetical protein